MIATNIQCPICKQFIRYQLIEFHRADGAFDWDLKMHCACGPVSDPALAAQVEKFHKIVADRALGAQVRIEMHKLLGRPLLEALDKRSEV